MAQLIYRVSGVDASGVRVTRRFRSDPSGRKDAEQFERSVKDPRRYYDVRTRIDGRTVTKTFPTRKAADAYAAKTEHDKVRGTAVDPRRGRETFHEYATRWLETRRVGGRPLAPKTRELYAILLRKHLEPTFGPTPIGAISAEAVRNWYAGFSSPLTAAKSYRLLRAIMRTAVDDGRIGASPCRIKDGGVERSPERAIVGPDVALQLAEAIEPRFRCLVLLAAFGGLRLGEALALRRRHLDLEAGTVRIEEQVVSLGEGKRLVTAPKTHAGTRTVHLPSVALDALRSHLETHVATEDAALLFPSERGDLLPVTTFYRAWRTTRAAVGYPELHLHDLRHLAGTMAAWTGATARELMERMGHSSPSAAMRYQHAAADRDRAIASGLDAILRAVSEGSAR